MSKYQEGLTLLKKLHGNHSGEEIINQFQAICPKMADLTIETVFGDIMSRPSLDLKTRELCIISSLIALGHSLPQLRAHTEAELVAGATREEIIEVFSQSVFSVGFPASVNGLIAIKDLIS